MPGRLLFLSLVLLCGIQSYAQNTIGIPTIVNYSKQVYTAGRQNWNIVQDESGIMYFANNDGLLSFDGTSWRLYELPNKTIVRSLAIAANHRIYVGGQGEIGFFSPAKNGELFYTSLNTLVPEGHNDFADVWNTCVYYNRIFFRSNKKILAYDGKSIVVHPSVNWGFLGIAGERLLAIEDAKGLVNFEKGKWQEYILKDFLPKDNFLVRSVLSLNRDSILLVTLNHGLYLLKGDSLLPFHTQALDAISSRSISSATLLSSGRIALATNLGGCMIITRKGEFVQSLTRKEGIQNNNVLSVMMDRDQNIWLGLDNGIDLLTYNNSIRNIFPDQDNRNSGYTSAIHHGSLYLGLSTGLYRVRLDDYSDDVSYSRGNFEFIPDTEGQVWSLSNINDKLMMGHNKGAYIIDGGKAIPFDNKTGFWAFQSLNVNQPSSLVAAGTYNGISFYRHQDGMLTRPVAYSQVESARFVAVSGNIIWIAHPYKGVYSIRFDETGTGVASKYPDPNGILSSNHNKIFQLGKRIVLTSDNGVFEYDPMRSDFIRSEWLEQLIGKDPISYIKEDAKGNIWFCRDRKVYVLDRSFESPKIVLIPEIDGRIMANGFEHINIIDSNNVLIAAEKGFYHINYPQYKSYKLPLQVLIRRVQSVLQEDGLIYGGYGSYTADPRVQFRYNSLHFECSSTIFGQEQNTEYSYYLEGFDKTWSTWSRKTERDYTNLPAGNYIFHAKCRNNPDNISEVTSFHFRVLPPWYQTWWGYGLIFAAIFSILYFFYKRQQRKYKVQQKKKLLEQQQKYDEEQRRLELQHRLAIQESEKQIIELRNAKLLAEVEHKNSELATSAMNLVQKKEMLSRLKDDLASYKLISEPSKSGKEFQKIIRVIDKELDQDHAWEQFAIHFDSVHSNYLKRLKEKYPALTSSDLKLAAYLRLNLTSKEIAQLMNISLRGVETSRYRLRRKLGLGSEGLYDFLINL